MHLPSRFTIKSLFFAVLVTLAFSFTANAQFFKFSGSFTYSGIPFRPGNRNFDVSPDGKMGVVLRNDRANPHSAVISTFHPLLGDQFDTETFGFGPLEVRMAQVGSSLRAVVLTSQGGPRRIYLFDISPTGQLTEIAFTDLTTSGADSGSTMVLSGAAGLGWVGAVGSSGLDLVCFSLNTGEIVKRSPLVGNPETLTLNEGPGRRVIAYRGADNLKVVNVLDPANPVETASVPLVRNVEFSGILTDEIAFSANGRYAFLVNQLYNFAAVDLNTQQIVATLDTNFRLLRVEVFEDSQRRLLAVLSAPSGTVNASALLLIDATNPAQLQILKNISPAPVERFKFSNDGTRLFAASPTRLIAYNLPDFTTIWEQPVPENPIRANQMHVYGPDNEIVCAWWYHDGRGDGALIGAFPQAAAPAVTLSDSVNVNETAGGTNATFTVTLSAPTTHRVTVEYLAGNGTAEQDLDFTATSGALVLQPGTTSGNISIPILDDLLDEEDETINLRVAPNIGTIADNENTVTILDNDPTPTISIGDATAAIEGDTFPGALLSFPITLSAPSGRSIIVTYAAAPNTASFSDFFPSFSTITLNPGQTTEIIVVPITPDRLAEGDESFFVNLSQPNNVTINDGQATGTILDDDAPVLATVQNSQRAIALDSVTFIRDPFPLTNQNYFGADKRARIAIFTTNLVLTPGLQVTVQGVDAQQAVHQLPVEFIGNVPGFVGVGQNPPILTQIIVRLPDTITNAGDLQVSVTARGRTSNAVLLGVTP
ncbi:MAG TPA: Calx-beta domain-containing protein [Pyrinomonadaceae bacterium]|nr:Calx-beta domain-containing protein [Pyrinomonadaceae bacterium]